MARPGCAELRSVIFGAQKQLAKLAFCRDAEGQSLVTKTQPAHADQGRPYADMRSSTAESSVGAHFRDNLLDNLLTEPGPLAS